MVEHLDEQVVLVPHVVVERRRPDAELRGQPADGQLLPAFALEDVTRRGENLLTRRQRWPTGTAGGSGHRHIMLPAGVVHASRPGSGTAAQEPRLETRARSRTRGPRSTTRRAQDQPPRQSNPAPPLEIQMPPPPPVVLSE